MYQQLYYVPKDSGTLSDTLMAFGLTDLISQLVQQHTGHAEVTLQDDGGCYVIDAGVSIQESWLDSIHLFEQLPFVSSNKTPLPAELANLRIGSRNVDGYWDQMRRYQEHRKQLAEDKVASREFEALLADSKPVDDFSVVTYLGNYRMQAQAIHNGLAEQWLLSSQQGLALNLRTVLACFASPTADRDAIAAQWKKANKGTQWEERVTASQLFNPHMGKGQNRTKANGLTMGNEKSFWLLDYLKAVGLWLASAPRSAQGGTVRKNYVLAPKRLRLNTHKGIFTKFRDRLWNDRSTTAIKLDITSALLYTDALLEYSAEAEDLGILLGGTISDLVAGMNVANYQLLSQNSYTMMNLSFLGLPNWMPQIQDFEDARILQEIIQEHLERIRGIDEESSEGYTLLRCYRDFASGAALSVFFDFCAAYSTYLISELGRSHFYVKPFSQSNVERLIEMNEPQLTPIFQNQGFRNLADAIRRSTVSLQYKGRKNVKFDIQYGLGTNLKRKARYKDEFVQAVADFVQRYNDETARVYERSEKDDLTARRKTISEADLADLLQLMDSHDWKTVASLLIAFGYTSNAKDKDE